MLGRNEYIVLGSGSLQRPHPVVLVESHWQLVIISKIVKRFYECCYIFLCVLMIDVYKN